MYEAAAAVGRQAASAKCSKCTWVLGHSELSVLREAALGKKTQLCALHIACWLGVSTRVLSGSLGESVTVSLRAKATANSSQPRKGFWSLHDPQELWAPYCTCWEGAVEWPLWSAFPHLISLSHSHTQSTGCKTQILKAVESFSRPSYFHRNWEIRFEYIEGNCTRPKAFT